MSSSERMLVTGGAGFIGSHLVEASNYSGGLVNVLERQRQPGRRVRVLT
jgi:nucleoside-diphosphate-sugar epimerase